MGFGGTIPLGGGGLSTRRHGTKNIYIYIYVCVYMESFIYIHVASRSRALTELCCFFGWPTISDRECSTHFFALERIAKRIKAYRGSVVRIWVFMAVSPSLQGLGLAA